LDSPFWTGVALRVAFKAKLLATWKAGHLLVHWGKHDWNVTNIQIRVLAALISMVHAAPFGAFNGRPQLVLVPTGLRFPARLEALFKDRYFWSKEMQLTQNIVKDVIEALLLSIWASVDHSQKGMNRHTAATTKCAHFLNMSDPLHRGGRSPRKKDRVQ